ncbi:NUDIX domain-containing protein [Pseudovirgaria hyperparasitica]|uniref:NUDIX domain-containing protein n=1 Tax=Pseudovirgaria hyperparasitica TaxID=470096 RepID=A0A6A6VVI6_9PEZI|nr:NUDIX domain-containing protein [Pseudovirgaria hyperparasitica]KAF2754698.1 NUDIX domain-containing protein [Pseudovirgaria hyperparasitica]
MPKLEAIVPYSRTAKVTSVTDLPTEEAKWCSLKKIAYEDETGKSRLWEMAERRTRGKAGVDAVAIGNIILHPSRPPSTVLVIQYRPPLDAYTVEWPAGLVDADETVEQAAIRELKEETGYEGRVLSISPIVASDPGLTNANMQLCMMEVKLKEGDPEPEQRLDDGEHITRVTVPLSELYDRLVEYANTDRMTVAAKLHHFAAGMHFSKTAGFP